MDPDSCLYDLYSAGMNRFQRALLTPGRLAYEAPEEVRAVIASIGRTEDIRFSPDNKVLAVAAYLQHKVYFFSCHIDLLGSAPTVSLQNYVVMSSPNLIEPHGVHFLDNEHIAIGNRAADVCVFRVPAPICNQHVSRVHPIGVINGKGYLFADVKNPGSLACRRIGTNRYQIFVCNNFWNFISSHILELGNSVNVENRGKLIENGILLPDGISVSRDGAWVAISNHADGEVLIYRNSVELKPSTAPACTLRGIVCPHGVTFTGDGKLLVADAASQYIMVFESDDGNWSGVRDPVSFIRMMDNETFYSGRYDFREGGVKGVDVDNSNQVLLTTHQLDAIAFFHLPELLRSNTSVDRNEFAGLCKQRDVSIDIGKSYIRSRRWNLKQRFWGVLGSMYERAMYSKPRVHFRAQLKILALRNRLHSGSILDDSGPVVSLTTHGDRIRSVHYAIESIACGAMKPSRLILWLSHPGEYANVSPALERLRARGLEIRLTQEYGPHTKYYPLLNTSGPFSHPVVTADDDVIYPKDWLRKLLDANQANPKAIHCFRVRRMTVFGEEMGPYNTWPYGDNTLPSHGNFITGVSGAIYPPDYLEFLKRQGDEFRDLCPTADDIWLTVCALRAGFRIAQVQEVALSFEAVPGTQLVALYQRNVTSGGNQVQLKKTFTPHDVSVVRDSLQAERA